MPRFRIIYTETAQAKTRDLNDWSRMGGNFDNAEKAKARCKSLTADHIRYDYSLGKNVEPYVFKIQLLSEEEDYQTREITRVAAGDYKLLPQIWQVCEYTFAYYNAETKLISYFDGSVNAERNRRTEMKPTRFWDRHVGDSNMFEAMLDAGMMVGDISLKFANTREDIRRVYETGPSSCMSSEARQYYSSEIHPVEAYASPDLELAYLTVGDEIISRTLCNANSKEYVRIYGDIGRMETFLKAAGYTENEHCMGGVRILKIFGKPEGQDENRAVIMTPYIDGPNVQMTLKSPQDEFMTIMVQPIIITGSTQGYHRFR